MKALTILQVCSIKGRGGTGYMAGHICRLLHEKGHRVLLAACEGSKVGERMRGTGVEIVSGVKLRRGFHPLDLWNDVRLLRQIIKQENVDIVHAWHSIEYWTCALAARGTQAKLARTRGLVTPPSPHFFNRLLHDRTAAVFATCKKIEDNYRAAGFGMDNVFRLDDGVDVARFRPGLDRMTVRNEVGIPADAPVVACVGRLEPIKNQATLLVALTKIPQLHALLAGDGSLREELEQQAESLGVGNRVHFLGVRSDVELVLASADIFVLCSIGSEGSSRGTLEAMAAGLPCVTANVGMLPDIIQPEQTGFLFAPKDVETLAKHLRYLLENPDRRAEIGRKVCELARERFSEAVMSDNIAQIYRRITEE
jgi:glycosyltransferase involved in cell wall biosynthesis